MGGPNGLATHCRLSLFQSAACPANRIPLFIHASWEVPRDETRCDAFTHSFIHPHPMTLHAALLRNTFALFCGWGKHFAVAKRLLNYFHLIAVVSLPSYATSIHPLFIADGDGFAGRFNSLCSARYLKTRNPTIRRIPLNHSIEESSQSFCHFPPCLLHGSCARLVSC